LYLITLLLVGLTGALLTPAGKNGPDLRAPAAITLGALITVFAAGMAVARLRKHPWTVHEIAARMPGNRLKGLIGGDVLANASLGREGWGAGFLWTLLYWTCDLGCLAIAFPAIGMIPPWRGLLIAYAAGQVAALLPITPGALGTTADSMSAALAAYGGTSAGHGGTSGALAAVLLTGSSATGPSCPPELFATSRSGALNRKPVRGSEELENGPGHGRVQARGEQAVPCFAHACQAKSGCLAHRRRAAQPAKPIISSASSRLLLGRTVAAAAQMATAARLVPGGAWSARRARAGTSTAADGRCGDRTGATWPGAGVQRGARALRPHAAGAP
jgi:hypothetical protein